MGKKLIKQFSLTTGAIILFGLVVSKYYNPGTGFIEAAVNRYTLETAALREYIAASAQNFPANAQAAQSNHDYPEAIPVLLYHGIQEQPQGEETISVSRFREHLYALKRAGYSTITIEQFARFMRNEIELPPKSFLLTFDDGRKDSYYPTDPILRALGFNAIMFIITGHVKDGTSSQYYLTMTELQKMQFSGRWQLQSHGRYDHNPIVIDESGTHDLFIPNRQWLSELGRQETREEHRTRVYEDLLNARLDMQELFDIDAVSFAFPRGNFGDNEEDRRDIINITRSVYPIAFFQFGPETKTGFYRYNYRHDRNTYLLRRIKGSPYYTSQDLLSVVGAGQPKTLPYIERYDNRYNWISVTAINPDEVMQPDHLVIRSHANQDTGIMFLDGGQTWINYRFNASIKLAKGSTFDVAARSVDGYNFLSCLYYDNGKVEIKQRVANTPDVVPAKILAAVKGNFRNYRAVSITVQDRTVRCFVDDVAVLESSAFDPSLSYGAIGFKVWDKKFENAELEVKNISVESL